VPTIAFIFGVPSGFFNINSSVPSIKSTPKIFKLGISVAGYLFFSFRVFLQILLFNKLQ